MPKNKHPTRTPLKLHHHRHTGRLLHHKHTSFRAVFLLLAVLGVFLAGFQYAAVKADDLEVTAKISALPVTDPAIFTSPANGFVTDKQNITVEGNCQLLALPTIIAIYNDGVLAGSTICQPNSTFNLAIMLHLGSNRLIAKSYNITEDPGPDSTPLTIIYEPPADPASGAPSGEETPPTGEPETGIFAIVISSREAFLTFGPDKPAEWVGDVSGGTPPYELKIDWGDGSDSHEARIGTEEQNVKHKYKEIRTHFINITARDARGQEAKFELAAVTPAEQTAGGPSSTAPIVGGTVPTPGGGTGFVTFMQIYTAYTAAVTIGAIAWVNTGPGLLHHSKSLKLKLPKLR